ncbi:MAG: ATP-binding cassette domain-containing protein [Devosia sp.]
MPVLSGLGLYRFYHAGDEETVALKGVDISLEAGDFIALMGPSGSGKSTLLACLAGLDDPDGGVVEVMRERMSQRSESHRAGLRARHIGMLMQSGNLLDHLDVAGNVALQRWLSAVPPRGDGADVLTRLGLQHRTHSLPVMLSGGEAARAGLAVALAASPPILMCDEPTAEVDASTERDIIELLHEKQRAGVAILVATHSAVLARAADRILHIADGRLS